MLKQSQIDTIRDISQHVRLPSNALKNKFAMESLKLYITVALTYKSQDALQHLFFVHYLGRFRNEHEKLSCNALHPSSWIRRNSQLEQCISASDHYFDQDNIRVSKETWTEKKRYFANGIAMLAIPDLGIKKLTRKDHDRVRFYVESFDLIVKKNIDGLIRLLATHVPLIFILGIIDDSKLKNILNTCSRQELIMVSAFLDGITFQTDRFARLKLSGILKERISQRVASFKSILAPIQSLSIISSVLQKLKALSSSYPYAFGLIHSLRLIISDEYIDKLPNTIQNGGVKISFKSVGLLIVLFFSFVFSLAFSLLTLPIFIIKDSFTYFGGKSPRNYSPEDDTYNEDGLNFVYLSMINRLTKIFKWLPDNLLSAARHDPVKFNLDFKLDKPVF